MRHRRHAHGAPPATRSDAARANAWPRGPFAARHRLARHAS
ncbi:conserved hypothetical protein [Burkholderia mallei NCTC 10229]|uniref:Uncharacterized protein n=1 Tax=Burkholderia mallei (strain NCTC 10229) TaxID=412022 RepID=A2S9E5_BURM9|nr:conserved hypothetical protein [Burkholderia mallei NCTC 10229]